MASEELVIKSAVSDEVTIEEKHEFSSPWERSDLILVVEDQKLHVHRVFLVMASPVFKSMLSSDVKERNETEISLPGKKASEFVEFLRMIYHTHKVALSNIKYIYILADEYQVQSVTDACREFLINTKKTKENAKEILVLAQLCKAKEAQQQCYAVLNEMTVAELQINQAFVRLDEQFVRKILLPKAERLEKCLKDVLPQIVGLIDCLLYLWQDPGTKNKMGGAPVQCPVHSLANISMNIRLKCDACQQMFKQMASNSKKNGYGGSPTFYIYHGMYFDGNMVSILKEMHNLLKL